MTKNRILPEEIELLIQTPPPSWQLLSNSIINVSRNCVLAIDRDGKIFLANNLAKEKTGASTNSELKDVFPALEPYVNTTLQNGERQVIQSLRFGTKEYRVIVNPLQLHNENIGVICLLEDFTEFERVAKQMRFFQNMTSELEAIINSSSDGLFVCNAKGDVIRMNPASERIHKVEAKQVIGKNMVDLIEEGFIDKSAALHVIEKKETVSLLQEKDKRKIISIGTPVFDNRGSLISVVVSERDITEIETLHRDLEEQESLKDQLQHQLLEMQLADFEANEIIARSPSMIRVLEKALKVSSADSTVLITGESGVGKGLITNLIHNNSTRAKKPLIRINCGAIPESLIESELFGYEEGAFTGAKAGGKPGSLELANGGSLFLDEIGELPLASQVKLLRFLEKGRLTRVGGTKVITVDARILVATHRNLQEMVANGTFRQDLYYRLSVIPLQVPPLRERKECILPLVHHYFDHFVEKTGVKKKVSRAALDALLTYPYPGNVRELMNICEHSTVLSEGNIIDYRDLPKVVRDQPVATSVLATEWPEGMSLKQILENVEKKVLSETLKVHKSQATAASALGVSQPTIARRMKKFDIG